jgi:hypothetical protein
MEKSWRIGKEAGLALVYVGKAPGVMQHLVRRDSRVVVGTSAVALNPDYGTEVRSWKHPDFAQRLVLEAAELVASEVRDEMAGPDETIHFAMF